MPPRLLALVGPVALATLIGTAAAQTASRPTPPGRFPFLVFCQANPPLVGQMPAVGSPKPENAGNGSKPDRGTEAERVTRLQRLVETSEKQLEQARKQLDDPDSEYHRAGKAFRDLDGTLNARKKLLDQLKKADKKPEAEAAEKELADLQKKWEQARDRFNLAIEERKTLQERVASLPGKLEREKKALEKLLNGGKEVKPSGPKPTASDATAPAKDAAFAPADAAAKEDRPKATAPDAVAPEPDPRNESEQVRKARQAARAKQDAARTAREKADRIAAYLEELQRQIALETRLLETARKKAENAGRHQAELEQEQRRLTDAKAPEGELLRGRQKVNDAVRAHEEAAAEVADTSDQLADMQASLTRVQTRQTEALQEAEKSEFEARAAEKEVDRLQNPFNPQNILQWLAEHGARLLGILIGMIALHFLVRTLSRRIVTVMGRVGKRLDGRESENRAATLVSVFRNFATLLILGGGLLMVLDEVGIPIVPLMGGAAVFGLAVAFGAQNLIRDYFSGFMVLLEDQYAVNDVVHINGIDGKVERISLRVTVLRDLAGVAHFIPHGSITTVSNLSHGWSRAMFEIGVAYKEDVDRVIEVLRRLCDELCLDSNFGPLIIDLPEMLGVDALADSAVTIKFVLKTKPLKQWDVKRELLRRIKKKFDQLGIEIPFPHRTVYYRPDPAATTEDERDRRGPLAA